MGRDGQQHLYDREEQIRLKEQLWLQAEELRVTAYMVNRTICYYDVPTRTLTVPKDYARERQIAEVIPGYPDNMFKNAKEYFPEAPGILGSFCAAMVRGEPTGHCEVPFKVSGKEDAIWKRMEYAMVYDRKGKPHRAVVFVEDVTDQHRQASEYQRLKENERILRLIAQHSDRNICYYDIRGGLAQVWDEDTCARCQLPHLCQMSVEEILACGSIMPESLGVLRHMFREIHDGKPQGAIKIRVQVPDGTLRWFDLKYSTILDDRSVPSVAMISHKDITEQYEHELAYLRQVKSLKESRRHLGMLEVDLETDRIESQGGKMIPYGNTAVGMTLAEFSRRMVEMKMLESDWKEGMRFFSREHLMERYAVGIHQLEQVWQMRFRNGFLGWVRVEAELLSDPYTNHRKAFFRLTDITEEKLAQMEIQSRSERDGMTSLFNRVTCEDRICDLLKDGRPGALILLDLDDLKGINDTLGHGEGDKAIMGIAQILKSHFRENDIVGRIGGDEFLIYLPGESGDQDAIAASLSSLLRKLTGVSIGEGNQQRIHCSMGCALQASQEDSFEVLYKRADIALYHTKRNGKNNYAFYAPEMEQENYRFQAQRLISLRSEKKFEVAELQHLLGAICDFYQLVLSINLTINDYFLMEEIKDGVFSRLPACGRMDDFVRITTRGIHPSDVEGYLERLSRESLLQAYEQGLPSVRHYFRFRTGDKYRWTEATAIFYINEDGDVCDFTLVRWADERSHELEQLWLQKVLELTLVSSFEYICLVYADSGEYSVYVSSENSHFVPGSGNFDQVTREIRDRFLQPEDRESYYEHANLTNVIAHMKSCEDSYTYRYQMPDGEREAAFHWFEPARNQLLMTVRRC